MSVRPRYVELRALLEEHGINANRVFVAGADDMGYDYVQETRDGRPLYIDGFKLKTERVLWPTADLWGQVHELYFGTPADGLRLPVAVPLAEKVVEQVKVAKPTSPTKAVK